MEKKVVEKKTGVVAKVLEGALAGAVLGVAAGMFINSKKGKEVQKNVKHTAVDFYKSVSPKLKKMKKMGEVEFKVFMKDAVLKYGKAKKMSEAEIKELMKEAQSSWKHLAKHF
ncbi:YtxH domain-containing protein [Candidatus Parcubacteria bacterium]|nr:YtxH domain-containing protein [Candidatus Parcubacteria bacterium]